MYNYNEGFFDKRRGTLFTSLLIWLAVEVLSPCQKAYTICFSLQYSSHAVEFSCSECIHNIFSKYFC